MPPAAIELSKRNISELEKIKKKLAVRGFYNATPYDIRPFVGRLRRADVSGVIQEFAKKLAAHQEPQTEPPDRNAALPLERKIENWLRQFDDDDHVECALQCLSAFCMITRADTVAAVRAFVALHPEFTGATIVPFGDAGDSGVIHNYFANDLVGQEIECCSSLQDAVNKKARHIAFIDDFAASGGQATDIVAAGFNIEALRRPLGEQREMFGDDIREHLRGCKTGFIFTAAWDDGVTAVRHIAAEVGLVSTVYRYLDESEIPFAFRDALKDLDSDVVTRFRRRCEEIGAALLSEGDGNGVSRKIEQRVLGYGNRAMLLASPFNVPAQTLTAMWKSGQVDTVEWRALMKRRKKATDSG